MQTRRYKTILTKNFTALAALGGKGAAGVSKLRNLVMELRKCCNHPYLFTGGAPPGGHKPDERPEEALAALIAASGKLALLDKMMARLRARGHRWARFGLLYVVLCVVRCALGCVLHSHTYTPIHTALHLHIQISKFKPTQRAHLLAVHAHARPLGGVARGAPLGLPAHRRCATERERERRGGGEGRSGLLT